MNRLEMIVVGQFKEAGPRLVNGEMDLLLLVSDIMSEFAVYDNVELKDEDEHNMEYYMLLALATMKSCQAKGFIETPLNMKLHANTLALEHPDLLKRITKAFPQVLSLGGD